MNLEGAERLARAGRLYPAVILHGATASRRQEAALRLAGILLCEADPAARPCGACRHCRRLAWPGGGRAGVVEPFHPDFQVLERDLRTVTSVDAARAFLRAAQVAPYEARGQVFAVASAETLSGEAANAFLKALEEPQPGAPRHFLLLVPSRHDLLATLRSRSLAVYLGAAAGVDPTRAAALACRLGVAVAGFLRTGSAAYLLAAAEALAAAGPWDDPRATGPWSLAAAAVLALAKEPAPAGAAGEGASELRRRLLGLAEDLLEAPRLRVRGIQSPRILEGLLALHLAGPGAGTSPLRSLP